MGNKRLQTWAWAVWALLLWAYVAGATSPGCTSPIKTKVLKSFNLNTAGFCEANNDDPPFDACVDTASVPLLPVPSSFNSSVVRLPMSATGQLLTLSYLPAGAGTAVSVGRSYESHAWESVVGLVSPLSFFCECPGVCVVDTTRAAVQADGNWLLEEQTADVLLGPCTPQSASRFLMQATFGPTNATITTLTNAYNCESGGSSAEKEQKSNSASEHVALKSWVHDQMALPPTLHRAYWRSRTNPRLPAAASVPAGTSQEPCSVGSRWHEWAFTLADIRSTVVVADAGNGVSTLTVDGVLRTEVDNTVYPIPPGNHVITGGSELTDGTLNLLSEADGTTTNYGNPKIAFSSFPSLFRFTPQQATLSPVLGEPGARILTAMSAVCPYSPVETDAFLEQDGIVYRFDRRLTLLSNTVDTPASVNPGAVSGQTETCPVVERTFINSGSCLAEATCAPVEFESTPLTLNDTTLRAFYTASARPVYSMLGLRLEFPYLDSPCQSGRSRWERAAGACTVPAPTQWTGVTQEAIRAVLRGAALKGTHVKDVSLDGVDNCNTNSATVGASLTVDGECYTHVHPELHNVVDASFWSVAHPGNNRITGFNPILQIAEDGSTVLFYQPNHSMSRWQSHGRKLAVLGVLGETIDFRDLPIEMRSSAMADFFGVSTIGSDKAFEACGSHGETANEPTMGHRYTFHVSDSLPIGEALKPAYHTPNGKTMVMNNIAMYATDQLRQRMAWTLSQIVVISATGLGRVTRNELYHTYYDIYVRNAFGNYRTILREMSYSPSMAIYLTYLNSRSLQASGSPPDENYARELMQLFTIGLFELNMDGTYKTDVNGNPVDTYDTEDVINFARAWTGFRTRTTRANVEEVFGQNMVDPLTIRARDRDQFPKANLRNGYIGDGYPECHALPPHHWLNKKARYVKVAEDEKNVYGASTPDNQSVAKRLELSATSNLHRALCADHGSKCTFPEEVLLSSTIDCDGLECTVDDLQTVRVRDPSTNENVVYEYVRVACVHMAYYSNARTAITHQSRSTTKTTAQCADPREAAAGAGCCYVNAPSYFGREYLAFQACDYSYQLETFASAEARCESLAPTNHGGLEQCKATGFDFIARFSGQDPFCFSKSTLTWLDQPCALKIQVHASGVAAMVHDPFLVSTDTLQEALSHRANIPLVDDPVTTPPKLRVDNGNSFKVAWENGLFPGKGGALCAASGCEELGSSCLCPTTVVERVVFEDSSTVPTAEQVKAHLHIGSAPPAHFPANTFAPCSSPACSAAQASGGVLVFTKAASAGTWDTETVFQVPAEPEYPQGAFFVNKESVVMVGNTTAGMSFRNVPHFISVAQSDTSRTAIAMRDAEYETEAVLDHVFHHPNTAPFIAYRLIQRLVSSNPSPRYVEVVATAFATGQYDGDTYLGEYGDLGAAVVACLLDREARSHVLDADPSHGKLREPFIRLLHVMRAMEMETDGREFQLHGLLHKIGQEDKNSPTVFNYYLPEYAPPGPVLGSGLVSPESQLATSPFFISMLNGLDTLIAEGLHGCRGGFSCCGCSPTAQLNYAPSQNDAGTVVHELNLLLSSGRMAPHVQAAIEQAFVDELGSGVTSAIHKAMLLTMASAEFHTTQVQVASRAEYVRATDGEREVPSQNRDYKAIVVVFEFGGCDSFNRLTPYDGCTTDLYGEYQTTRTNVALPKTGSQALLPITDGSGTQPCKRFGVTPGMPTLKRLYDEGDALFLANTGVLVEPITKFQMENKVKEVPMSLFAHNIQQSTSQTVHAGVSEKSTGILGRIVDALSEQAVPWKANSYSIDGVRDALDGKIQPDVLTPNGGVSRLRNTDDHGADILNLGRNTSRSVHYETFNNILRQSIEKSEVLGSVLDNVPLSRAFPTTQVGRQFGHAARIVKARTELGNVERDVIFVTESGFDTHANLKDDQINQLRQIDTSLAAFEGEMKDEGLWDNVAILSVSDFARTLASNGAGTDHAWGGNYWLAGGAVKGGNVLGKYPDSLALDGPLDVGRTGRLIPTTSWEAVWNGMARWFGVQEDQMEELLPNRSNFPESAIFQAEDLFEATA